MLEYLNGVILAGHFCYSGHLGDDRLGLGWNSVIIEGEGLPGWGFFQGRGLKTYWPSTFWFLHLGVPQWVLQAAFAWLIQCTWQFPISLPLQKVLVGRNLWILVGPQIGHAFKWDLILLRGSLGLGRTAPDPGLHSIAPVFVLIDSLAVRDTHYNSYFMAHVYSIKSLFKHSCSPVNGVYSTLPCLAPCVCIIFTLFENNQALLATWLMLNLAKRPVSGRY